MQLKNVTFYFGEGRGEGEGGGGLTNECFYFQGL